MSCWEILEIPEHSDVAAIRHAYAVLAERYHPEEHEEEFLRVRDAYREAMALARGQARPSAGREEPSPPPEKAEQPVLHREPQSHPEKTSVPEPLIEKPEENRPPARRTSAPRLCLTGGENRAGGAAPGFSCPCRFPELYVSPRRRDRAAGTNMFPHRNFSPW